MKNLLCQIFLLILPLLCSHAQAIEEEIPAIDIQLPSDFEPLTCVADCVNIASGHFFQIDNDFVGNTIEPLTLTRYYDSQNSQESFLGYGFGSQYPLFASDVQKHKKHSYAAISERDGFLIPYQILDKTSQTRYGKVDRKIFDKSYTNLNRSHQGNLSNREALYKKDQSWLIKLGNGGKRLYKNPIEVPSKELKKMGLPTKTIYLLDQERKPNGNTLKFEYLLKDRRPLLAKVETVNRKGQSINKMSIFYTPDGCFGKTSCHNQFGYSQTDNPLSLNHVISSQKGPIFYTKQQNKITRVDKPGGQFLEVTYDKSKVISLQQPLGPDNTPITTYRFQYAKTFTKVWNPLQQLTLYTFDKQHRLNSINYLQNNQIIRTETFEWSTLVGQQGWLRKKSIRIGSHIYHLTAYDYDTKGNVTRTTLYGNLTGTRNPTFIQLKDTDQYSIHYSYSQDDRNLITKKITPEGLQIQYDYLPETNLCTKELTSYQGKIQERLFRTYDDNGQLKSQINDDGSRPDSKDLTDITYRQIKTITSHTEPGPSYGKPQQIIDSSLDQGQIILLKKTDYFYDGQGNDTKQIITTPENTYETTRIYDTRHCLLQETNPLGQTTLYCYDENKNKIEEELIGSGKITTYTYDAGNRLIRKEDTHENGQSLITSYTYNPNNQLITETDPYGDQTHYTYDRLGHQTQCIKPLSTTQKAYNILGQAILSIDENGQATKTTYNTYGSPAKIIHPDKSEEIFTYTPSGWLKQHRQPNGTTINYTHDPKGRLLKETTTDKTGILKETHYRYKGNLLKMKKDPMGLITHYHYDPAGRKTAEITQDKTLTYQYDSLNRLIKTQNTNLSTVFQYDPLNRLISKIQDYNGKLLAKETYEYNINGQKIQTNLWHTLDKIATQKQDYDSDNNLILSQDPLGYSTTYQYNHNEKTRLITDALGQLTREVKDNAHRLIQKEIIDKEQHHTIFYDYDPAGHKIQQRTNHPDYAIQWTYNSRGRLESETESTKTTRFTYDSLGHLIQKQKPDHVCLNYRYDSLGRLIKMSSTDNTIAYTYQYDLHDNPIEIHDLINHTSQKRTYDLFDRLIEEELSPGIILKYTYNTHDQLTTLTLPDNSTINYTYEGRLTKIQRLNNNYDFQYDLTGKLTQSTSLAGPINYTYDLNGKYLAIQALHWNSQLHYDPLGNLLIHQLNQDTETHTYNRFNHLTSDKTNHYHYDFLGNCLQKNHDVHTINALNQILDGNTYDPNGNLLTEKNISYTYDALNRLIRYEADSNITTFLYDAYDRCLQITTNSVTKQLLYQKDHEIGCIENGQLKEFRLIHPSQNVTLAIELDDQIYFPIQDHRSNICALRDIDGQIVQNHHYNTFGPSQNDSNINFSINNPWTFANRRQIGHLSLFTHRLYNHTLMRWQTPDPLGFKDGLNLYTYTHNNPHRYTDLDGCFAIVIPILTGTFGIEGIVIGASTLWSILAGACLGTTLVVVNHKIDEAHDNKCAQIRLKEEEEERRKEAEKNGENLVFPENPDELLPELPRDEKGHIYPSDNIRIRPERHEIQEGEIYDSRHHGDHFHVETRRDDKKSWGKSGNIIKLKPNNYQPGTGTGFLPGEIFPGG